MVTIKANKDKKIIDLYSALGYDKKISKYKFEALDGATSSFFRGYVNQGNTISRSRVDLEAARLCALNFLHENDRGERFWPANSEGILEYGKDCDREEITDGLTHIFRKKNYSDYVQELKQVKRRKEEEGWQMEKPKCGKKRSKKRKHDDDSLIAIKEGPTLDEKACIASVLELDPPEHPSDVYCGNYIRGLNPQFDLKTAKEFRRKWLSSKSPKWPSSADCRLLRFMFDNGLFIAYDHGDEIPAASLRSFREGTEIEEMSGSEVVTFRNLVMSRVQELTHQLTQKPSLILTYRGDGVIHMTERFERFWGKKEVFWEESAQPPKKRKKSKAIRAKPPLTLPNLQVQGDTISETLPTDDDRGSNLQFASVAETALNLSAGREALVEEPAEHSFFTKAMDINSEIELGITTSASSPRRNLSPEDSVVVAHPRTSGAHVPGSMQILCRSQEKQNSDRQGFRSPTTEHTPCMNGSGRPTLLLKIPMTIPPMTEKPQKIMDESISPIHEICSSNRSIITSNKCASPSESNASRRSVGSASASISLLNALNTEQTTSTRSNDLGTACPSKWHAEFSWLDPQTSTNAQTTQLMETSTTHDVLEPAASTPVDNRYASPYVPSSPKDREINFAGSQTPSASSTSGSNRSSLVEVLSDSGSPLRPSTIPDILVKRKRFRPAGERSRPGPLNMATFERQSNNILVEECLEEPWISEWTQGITCKPNSTTLNSASQSSTFNSSLKSSLLTDFSWQRTEPSDKPVSKQDVTYQSTPQLGSDGVEALVASCPLRPIRKSPTWKEFTSCWRFERQSSSAISNFIQAREESPRVPAEGISLPNLNKPAAVDNGIKEIDDSDQTEKTTSRQTSLKSRRTFDECTQSHRSITEEVGCEEKKSQTSHGLSHDFTPPDLSSLAVIFPPVNTGRQSFDAQREPRVPLGIITRDLTQRPKNRMAMPVQEPPEPPTQETPQRRNGSYSFVPPPEAFTLGQPATTAPPYTRAPPPPVLSIDRRLSTTSPLSGPSTPTLTLLIVSADGSMSLDTTHSFDTLKNSTLSEFFQFYSSVSGTPLSTLTSLEFQPAFGQRQSIEIRRYGGEDKWKTLKEVITTLFDRAVRKDKEGRMEWQVLISCE